MSFWSNWAGPPYVVEFKFKLPKMPSLKCVNLLVSEHPALSVNSLPSVMHLWVCLYLIWKYCIHLERTMHRGSVRKLSKGGQIWRQKSSGGITTLISTPHTQFSQVPSGQTDIPSDPPIAGWARIFHDRPAYLLTVFKNPHSKITH